MVSLATRSSSNFRELPGSGTVYYLLWRTRATHPWHSEEFDARTQADQRYFALIERGVEVYLERRRRSLTPA